MLKQLLSPLPLLLIFSLCYPTVFAQSPAQAPVAQPPVSQPPPLPPVSLPPPQPPVSQPPPQAPLAQPVAPTPAPPGPPNITAILEKAKRFSTFIRLLKNTQMDSQMYKLLNDSSQSLTVFAPNDNAFGNLTSGTLNSFNDQQKVQLVKFHVITSFISIPAFQTLSNPMSTQAGSSAQYPLNVTVLPGNQVNISTGVVNTTISGTVYSDSKLAVYEVDRVLLPVYFFNPNSPAPAPSKPAEKKAPSPSGSGSSSVASVEASGASPVIQLALNAAVFAGFLVAASALFI